MLLLITPLVSDDILSFRQSPVAHACVEMKAQILRYREDVFHAMRRLQVTEQTFDDRIDGAFEQSSWFLVLRVTFAPL